MVHNNLAMDQLNEPAAAPASLAGDVLTFRAPAKLNLGLRIFPRRPDGFHDIESWFVPISLYDTLTFHKAQTLTLQLSGLAAELSNEPEKNLVGRAALALARAAGVAAHAQICLHKLIPAGGGLGGGSSDAATTLLALKQLWNIPISTAELSKLAAALGSDVPFFIYGQSAVCRGRGEIIEPLPFRRLLFAVLIIPPYGTSTKDVYQEFDNQPAAVDSKTILWQEISQLSAAEISAVIRNDLEAPAFSVTPALRALRDKITALVGRPVHLSGSGSTLFILTDQPAQADGLAETLENNLPENIRVLPVGLLARNPVADQR